MTTIELLLWTAAFAILLPVAVFLTARFAAGGWYSGRDSYRRHRRSISPRSKV